MMSKPKDNRLDRRDPVVRRYRGRTIMTPHDERREFRPCNDKSDLDVSGMCVKYIEVTV